jgi:hypothetical protein
MDNPHNTSAAATGAMPLPVSKLIDLVDRLNDTRFLCDAAYFAVEGAGCTKTTTDAVQAVLGRAVDQLRDMADELVALRPEGGAE